MTSPGTESSYPRPPQSLNNSVDLLVKYDCAEQLIRALKARLFDDNLALSAIHSTDDPREQKRLDRHVRYFDHDFGSKNENI